MVQNREEAVQYSNVQYIVIQYITLKYSTVHSKQELEEKVHEKVKLEHHPKGPNKSGLDPTWSEKVTGIKRDYLIEQIKFEIISIWPVKVIMKMKMEHYLVGFEDLQVGPIKLELVSYWI